jgi:hypothetical protein
VDGSRGFAESIPPGRGPFLTQETLLFSRHTQFFHVIRESSADPTRNHLESVCNTIDKSRGLCYH